MNRDEKAAVIDEVAERIAGSQAIFAVDYRGLSVKQAVELRQQLTEAGAHFQVVKNRLTVRAADKAGAEDLKELLEGPTALTFVQGDPAVAAKAIATFRRANNLLEWKGGRMDGEVLSVDQLESIARLPARDVLHGQFVGVLASPITGLVRGLASMISGLASQLQQIADQGLVAGEAPEAEAEEAPAEEGETAPEGDASPEEAPAEEADASADKPASEDEGAGDDSSGDEPPAEEESESGDAPDDKEPAAAAEAAEAAKADDSPADDEAAAEASEDAAPAEEAPGSATAEGETAEQEEAETSESSEEPSEAQNQEEEG